MRFLYCLGSFASLFAALWLMGAPLHGPEDIRPVLPALGLGYLAWWLWDNMPTRAEVAEEKRRKSGLQFATKPDPVTGEST